MREYVSIQYLRGVAAAMVVMYHLGQPLSRLGYTGGWSNGLSGGVDIFFVISGFVMWMTTHSRQIRPAEFYLKRVVRIVPLYWFVTSVMLTVLLIAPDLMQTSVFYFGHVLKSYLFIPALNPGKPSMEPLLFAGWTLNYEMFFYLIFGGMLLARKSMDRLVGTTAPLLLLVIGGAIIRPAPLSVFGFYTSSIMLEFVYGIVLAELCRLGFERRLINVPGAIVLITVGFVTLLGGLGGQVFPRGFLFGIPALLIVTGSLAIEARGRLTHFPLLHLLGNASYSIYLTQLLSMAAFNALVHKIHLSGSAPSLVLFAVLDVGVAIVAGLLCFRFVERPLVALLRGFPRGESVAT